VFLPTPTASATAVAGQSLEPPATEHKGATNQPVGQVEGDVMEPNNCGSGTSDID